MFVLIKNVDIYQPEPIGKKDVFIAGKTIALIEENVQLGSSIQPEIIDGTDKKLVPGFIDSHVHILGGGGEGSYKTRTPEIMLSDIVSGGVTTVIGCLGTDGVTRTMSNLVAKARGLEEEGVSCFIYTGSYQVPVRTLTESVLDDLILIDKIIGVGEIALSDHRSSQPTKAAVANIVAQARVGGMLSGKAGVVNIHMGDGKRMLTMVEEILNETEIPITQFLPTHMARNQSLWKSGFDYVKKGGLIDITTSSTRDFGDREVTSAELLAEYYKKGLPIEQMTMSSDGQGSLPIFDHSGKLKGLDVGKVSSLYEEVRSAIQNFNVPIESGLKVITSNPARILKLTKKGLIKEGNDADVVLLDKDLNVDTVISNGQIMIQEGQVQVKGTFET